MASPFRRYLERQSSERERLTSVEKVVTETKDAVLFVAREASVDVSDIIKPAEGALKDG